MNSAIDYAGKAKRSGDLFSTKNQMNRFLNKVRNAVKDVPNIFAQHKPYLMNILTQVSEGTLKESDFVTSDLHVFRDKPNEIIVFIVGGATYEEAREIGLLNREKYTNILLGGTFVHNSKTFLAEISKQRNDEYANQDSRDY